MLYIRSSIAALAVTLGLAGCPGDDTTGDSGPATSGPATDDGTTAGPTPTTGGPAMTTGGPSETSGGPAETTTGPSDSSGSAGETTAGMGCGTNVMQSPECDACTHANCCPEVQACFGDETVTEDTDCLLLNNCIATMCAGAMSLMEVQDCVDMNCPEVAGAFDVYLPFNSCVTMNCIAECGGG